MIHLLKCGCAALAYLAFAAGWPYRSLRGFQRCPKPASPQPPPLRSQLTLMDPRSIERRTAISHLTHLASARALLSIDASFATGTEPSRKYGAPSVNRHGQPPNTISALAQSASSNTRPAPAQARCNGGAA